MEQLPEQSPQLSRKGNLSDAYHEFLSCAQELIPAQLKSSEPLEVVEHLPPARRNRKLMLA